MLKKIISGYIFFAPFTTWLALTGWLRLPVLFILIGFVLSIPLMIAVTANRPLQLLKSKEDTLLLICLALITISFLGGSMTGRSFNHLLSFVFVFIFYLMYFKFIVIEEGIALQHIFKIIAYSTTTACLIIIVEWILLNAFGILIRPYFILSESTSNMIYYQQPLFKSIAGLAEEPSLMAFNLNIFFPIGLYYFKETSSSKATTFYIFIYLFALLCTASAGGIGFIILAYFFSRLLTAGLPALWTFAKRIAFGIILLILSYHTILSSYQLKIDRFINKIINKLSLIDVSASMRINAWKNAINDWQQAPFFGLGPAYGNDAYQGFGYQSAYLKILAETGIFSLLFFLIYLAFVYIKILNLNKEIKPYFLISITAGLLHLFIADAYYHVTLWIVIALLQLIFYENELKTQQDTLIETSSR